MKASSQLHPNMSMETLHLHDFCGVEDPETMSEEGVELLIKNACAMVKKGWEFVECTRGSCDPCIFHLIYRKGKK